jgi:Mg2+/Co2+ transporter CorB
MATLDLFNHLINFLAPALAVGVVLALVGPWFMKKSPSAPGLFAQSAINFVAGALALGAGLWFFGNDGKMASYGAMVVVCAISQALAVRR